MQANYWSSGSVEVNPSAAWGVTLDLGYLFDDLKIDTIFVWPVRGGQ